MKNVTKILAKAPQIEDISKAGSKKVMFSIKDKRKVASYAMKYTLKPQVLAAVYQKVTPTMLKLWVNDYNDGKFHLRNAVSVSRR